MRWLFILPLLCATAFSQTASDCGLANVRCVGSAQEYSSIQAAANVAVAGDTVLVMDGTYTGFHSVNSGTATSPITFKAAGSNAVINAQNEKTPDCINIENTDYVTVDGFKVQNSPRAGIRVATANGVIVRNNSVGYSYYWGIFTAFTTNLQIVNNKAFNTTVQHGIYVSNSDAPNDNPIVRGNEVYNNNQNGIQLNGDCEMGGDGTIDNALIEKNIVHDNKNNAFALISMQTSTVRNNLSYGNGSAGGAGAIHLTDQVGCGHPSSNNVVENNTIAETQLTGMRMTQGATGNVIFNNLIYGQIVDEVGTNNIDSTSNLTGISPASYFVNPGANNYHLLATAPAVDHGRSSYSGASAPADDMDGVTRPQGTATDIGAYEFAQSGSGTGSGSGTCSFTLSATSANLSSNGGTGSVNVTAGSGCAWTASSNASWISISSGSTGSANGTVTYVVAPNATTSSRTGTMTVAGQTFTVTEDPASGSGSGTCSFALSATSANLASNGGTGSVSVTAGSGCAWTASSNTSWISISSGSTGSANGTVTYVVAPNSTGARRTGTMTVAGQTFTVTEDRRRRK